MVGETLSDGTYAKFDFSLLDKLPQKPSRKTNERAALILKMLGFEDEQIEGGNETEDGETNRGDDVQVSGTQSRFIRHFNQR